MAGIGRIYPQRESRETRKRDTEESSPTIDMILDGAAYPGDVITRPSTGEQWTVNAAATGFVKTGFGLAGSGTLGGEVTGPLSATLLQGPVVAPVVQFNGSLRMGTGTIGATNMGANDIVMQNAAALRVIYSGVSYRAVNLTALGQLNIGNGSVPTSYAGQTIEIKPADAARAITNSAEFHRFTSHNGANVWLSMIAGSATLQHDFYLRGANNSGTPFNIAGVSEAAGINYVYIGDVGAVLYSNPLSARIATALGSISLEAATAALLQANVGDVTVRTLSGSAIIDATVSSTYASPSHRFTTAGFGADLLTIDATGANLADSQWLRGFGGATAYPIARANPGGGTPYVEIGGATAGLLIGANAINMTSTADVGITAANSATITAGTGSITLSAQYVYNVAAETHLNGMRVLGSFAVASLPAANSLAVAYATNARCITGTNVGTGAFDIEGAGSGSGSLVQRRASDGVWHLAGTTVVAVA